jgi:hypothetical protein
MNKDPITLLLAAALLVSASATAGLCYWYLQCVREHQMAQEGVVRINQKKSGIQAMATESIEYSKRNPALLPVLQSLGINRRSETNTASPRLEK